MINKYICYYFTLNTVIQAFVNAKGDYDFHEVDEYLAGKEVSWVNSRTAPKQGPTLGSPPDSPIGYEADCGIQFGKGLSYGENDYILPEGRQAKPGEFPWQVSLQLRTGWLTRHICGGTILSSHWIVTAGHCVSNLKPKAIVAVAGEYDLFRDDGNEQRVEIVRIINGGYKEGSNFEGDIALLQVAPKLLLNEQVSPICLPQPNIKYENGNATVTGWGRLTNLKHDHILQQVTVPLIHRRHCQELYDGAGLGRYINKSCQICGSPSNGRFNSCQGESGGPLICRHADKRHYLCGIVSWGVGCARSGLPGVYTEVPCYIEWIKTVLYNVNGLVSSLPAYSTN